eukprot:TRINITY_DN8401_c0_g1_i2.p1 TRINITY_DN8401_c0_g1~~TRINITY_DN8401_c0_g1_i2.p1  ORF type:complete len:315 (+),score=4.50 TRINITY_DN8401_c0_g1_i2:420-1364(+)
MIVNIMFTIIVISYLLTSEPPAPVERHPFNVYAYSPLISIACWIVAAIGLWTHCVLHSLNAFSLASSYTFWYWSSDSRDPEHQYLSKELNQLSKIFYFRFHFGSVAIQAGLAFIFNPFIFLFGLLSDAIHNTLEKEKKTKKRSELTNFCLNLVSPCFDCHNRLLRFLGTSAFTLVVLTGGNFLQSSQREHFIRKRSDPKFRRSPSSMETYTWVAHVAITVVSSSIGYLYLTRVSRLHVDRVVIPAVVFVLTADTVCRLILKIPLFATEVGYQNMTIESELSDIQNHERLSHCPPIVKELIGSARQQIVHVASTM